MGGGRSLLSISDGEERIQSKCQGSVRLGPSLILPQGCYTISHWSQKECWTAEPSSSQSHHLISFLGFGGGREACFCWLPRDVRKWYVL